MTDKSGAPPPNGLRFALAAYLIWGFVPVYFKLLGHVLPVEIVAQRILWSIPLLLVIMAFRSQLADYAAMRTFANTDPDAGAVQKLPTILSLFADSSEPVPLSVTQWDLSYLSALYKARLAASGNAQQRSMAKQIRSDAVRAADNPQH